MRYEARVVAYDMLTEVVVTAYVVDTSVPDEERPANQYRWSTSIAGEGEADPAQWLQGALVGLLELL